MVGWTGRRMPSFMWGRHQSDTWRKNALRDSATSGPPGSLRRGGRSLIRMRARSGCSPHQAMCMATIASMPPCALSCRHSSSTKVCWYMFWISE